MSVEIAEPSPCSARRMACNDKDDDGGFRFALSALHLDSRLRGNDRRECPPEADRVFGGVPQVSLFYSPMIGGFQGVEERVPQ